MSDISAQRGLSNHNFYCMNPCERSIFYFHSSTKHSAFPSETGAFFIASPPMPILLYLSKAKFPHGKLVVKWSRRKHKTFMNSLYVFHLRPIQIKV